MANYVKNKDLREELIKSRKQNELTKEALEMIILMANKFSTKFQYKHIEDRDDCVAFAIMDCYIYWKRYNPDKSDNAFSYITQILKNGFAKGWRKLHGKCPLSLQISLSNNTIYTL